MRDEKQRFSLRKLSVGLASVLIGITFLENGQTVKADTVNKTQENAITETNKADDSGSVPTDANTQNDNAVKQNTDAAQNKVQNSAQDVVQNKVQNNTQIDAPNLQQNTDSNVKQNNIQTNTPAVKPVVKQNAKADFNTVTTTILDLNFKSAVSVDMLKSSKIQTQQNSDDPYLPNLPAGNRKTPAGYTNLPSNTLIAKDVKLETTTIPGNYEVYAKGNFDTQIKITATLGKNDIKNGNDILLATTHAWYTKNGQIQGPANSNEAVPFWHVDNGHTTPVYLKDQQIGNLVVANNATDSTIDGECNIWLHVTNTMNDLATDPTVTIDLTKASDKVHMFDTPFSETYDSMRGVSDSKNNFVQHFLIGTDKAYNLHINPNPSYGIWDNIASHQNQTSIGYDEYENHITISNLSHHLFDFNDNSYDRTKLKPIVDGETDRVIRISNINKDNPVKSIVTVANDLWVYQYMANGKITDDAFRAEFDVANGTKQLANNLSARDLLNQTQINQATWSVQDNGDILVAFKKNADSYKIGQDALNTRFNALRHDYLNQIYDPAHADENMAYTEKTWTENPYYSGADNIFLGFDRSKPAAFSVSDVTPTSDPYVEPAFQTTIFNSLSNTSSFNAELYRNTTIQYLDDDANEKQISRDSLTGRKNVANDYTVNIPQGFVLAKDNSDGTNYKWSVDKKKISYTFQDDQKQNDANPIIIHLVHNHETVDHGNSDSALLYANRKRTIHYVYDDGTKALDDVVQPVLFTRTATEDMANHDLSNFSEWVPDNDYPQVSVPIIHGYTPSQNIVSEASANPDHDTAITVTYSKNKQQINVSYIDDTTGATLDTKQLDGYSGDDAKYSTKSSIDNYKAHGYELVSDPSNGAELIFDKDDFINDQDITVHLRHVTQDTNLEHDVTRTIHYVYANGQKAKDDYSHTFKFAGTETVDKVTGKVVKMVWTPETKNFDEVASPLIHGYTANQTLMSDIEVNPASDNIVQTVTYNPNKQNIHVVFMDDTTGKILNTVSKAGYTGTDSGYATQDDIDSLIAKGYKLVSDSTPKDHPTLMFDSDDFTDDQNFTIHVKHDTKESNLSREVSRTIHYVYRDGKPAGNDHTDSIKFNGVETIDKVDGHVISTVWTPESKEFASVTTPSLQGYTPDKFSVDSSTIKPDSDNIAVTITYNPDAQYAKFNYIDDTTSNQLKQETSHGVTGMRDNYSTANLISYYKNKGYDLVSDDTANKVLTFDSDDNTDQVYNIHLTHGVITIDPQNPGKPGEKLNPQDPSSPVYPTDSDKLTSTVNREIDYVYEDGRAAKPSVKDSIAFNNTEKIDKVTGEIISSTWDGPKDFTEIQTPVIEGYTPSQSSVENKAVTHTTSPIKVVVTYSADPQHMKVIYRDLTDNRILSQMAKDGVSDEDSHYNTKSAIDGYLADGYLLSKDGTDGKDLIFDHNDQLDQTYYVDFTHGSHQYNPEKPDAKDKVDKNDYLADYTTTINYADNSGKALYSNEVVSDEYKRDLTIDSVTGNIIKRGGWTLNKGYTSVENPVITGYITAAKSVTPVDKQENQVINIVYNALGKVHSVDNKGKEIAKAFSYTNDPSDPTKVLVTKVPSVTGYEQVVFSVDPRNTPTKDTTVVFNAPATVTVNYIDSVTGKTVHTDTVKGFATHASDYTTQNEIGNLVKQGYVLAKDNVPSSIKLTEDPQNYSVILVHGISKVTHDKPIVPDTPISNTNQKMPKGVDKDDLNREITRTITVIDPHTGQHVTKQVAKLFRDATVDNVTGTVVYTDWNKGIWGEFTTPIVAGYTPSQNNVPAEAVTSETKNSAITITYTANPQTGKISYVDTDGKEVANTPLTGKTDEEVRVTPIIPHGWVVVDGQTIPDQVVATPNGIPTVSIKIKHGAIEVTPDKPKTPSDKMPDGDQYPDGVTQDDLNRDITRTINVANPHTGLHTTVQTAHLSRNAVVDLVTKAITYGKWSTATWDEFNASAVAGYTPSIKSVAKTPVDISTKNTVIDITYTANPQTGKISYVDTEGKEVAKTDLHGKTDEDIQVKPVIPHGWVIVDGQDIPTSVKVTADGISTVTIKIKHGILQVTPDKPHNPDEKMPDGDNYPKGVGHDDLNKDVTRQIILHEPTGDKTVSQVAKYTRIATIDLVTGKVIYSDWNTKHGWDEYTPEAVTGYTPSIEKLAQVDKPDKDTKVEINYTAIPSDDNWNSEPIQPSVPSQPEKPAEPAQPTDNNKPAEPTKKTQKRNKNKRKNKQVKRNNTKRQTQGMVVQTGYKRAGKMIANNSEHGNQLNRDASGDVSVNTSNKVSANVASNSNDTSSINPNNATTLPQTGEKRGTTEALAGILLASMGIATAIGATKRKKRE